MNSRGKSRINKGERGGWGECNNSGSAAGAGAVARA